MLLAEELCDFKGGGSGTSIVERNGRDGIGEKKSLTHMSLQVISSLALDMRNAGSQLRHLERCSYSP